MRGFCRIVSGRAARTGAAGVFPGGRKKNLCKEKAYAFGKLAARINFACEIVSFLSLISEIVAYDNDNHYSEQDGRYGRSNGEGRNNDSIYSKRVKAGKRRTYFFDVRTTRGNDYFLTITESKKRFEDGSYERHKMFLYKEDFHKFLNALQETINYVKTDLMPDFDFDAFNHDEQDDYYAARPENETYRPAPEAPVAEMPAAAPTAAYEPLANDVEVDNWKA